MPAIVGPYEEAPGEIHAHAAADIGGLVGAVFGKHDYRPSPSGRYRFGDTRHIFYDIGKLKAQGWSPKRAVVESVESYQAWLGEADSIGDILAYCQKQMAAMNVVREVKRG